LNRQFIAGHWYAYAYEQFETQSDDVDFFLKTFAEQTGDSPQDILEVACGGGRIAVPLARAGHSVTGFDLDVHRLLHCYRKGHDLPNLKCYQNDALLSDWGTNYDIVVLAGNLLINIEALEGMGYAAAQRLIIQKAAKALRPGGHVLLDYDQHTDESAAKFFNYLGEKRGETYSDDLGTSGYFKYYGGVYDPVQRICMWVNHRSLITNNGESIVESTNGYKHIPSLGQVYGWLHDAGLTIDKTWKNYSDEPLSESILGYNKATIWAKK